MKISEQWLRSWVDPDLDTAALAEQLTMAGLEVDSVEPAGAALEGVVVGRVRSVNRHPDAERLSVCEVEAGQGETLQIVCGAANVREGMLAPLATVGARLPDGTEIKAAKLRGVASSGMLCSAKELGIAETAEGLLDLGEAAEPGTAVAALFGASDQVIDIDLTPNRGDCLSVRGIAREVGTLNRLSVAGPELEPVQGAIDDRIGVHLDAPAHCPRYVGRILRGVNASAMTPLWMRERLRRAGLRSLGPVVDVTNYVMLELGQPMHAFDLAQLEGDVHVRLSQAGERLSLLDGSEVTMDEDSLVIADEAKALALAGIMGGEASAVTGQTEDILLESAFFAPLAIAGKARSYGLHTDSSHRFERGVDYVLQETAIQRATRLLLDIVGGEPGPVIEAVDKAQLPQAQPIRLRRSRIERVLGIPIPDETVVEILAGLGMKVSDVDGGWDVTPPSYRFDMVIEVDLIEEIGRIHGYDCIVGTPIRIEAAVRPESERRIEIDRLRQLLIDRGYREAITYSFVEPALQKRLDPDAEVLALSNPISSEMAVMRSSTWPGLLQALQHNLNRQRSRVRLFETGLCFVNTAGSMRQERRLGGLLTGSRLPEQWGAAKQGVDFFDAKGDVQALLGLSRQDERVSFRTAEHPALHPGQSAVVERDGQSLGWVGTLHPALEAELSLGQPALLFELALEALTEASQPEFGQLSRFPAIRRDIAVEVDESVPAGNVLEAARKAEPELLQEVVLFDIYRGKGVTTGRKSIAFGLILQDLCRTLTDDEVDSALGRILDNLKNKTGATLRE
jgi:phenylalanyl-tRNA synthetase beta chain